MAPEIVRKLPYGCKVDIWSLGMVAYIMLYGRPPFKGKNRLDIFDAIKNCQILYANAISQPAINFCRKMLERDVSKRCDAHTLLQDPWIIKNTQLSEIGDQMLLDISNNLKEFRKITVF